MIRKKQVGHPGGGLVVLGPLLAASVLGGHPAYALMPPYVYEAARDDAASIIVVTVEKVTPPRGEFGKCAVAGTVAKVERGAAYAAGQKVTLDVPCAKENASPPIGGTIYQLIPKLEAAKYGRAYLDKDGKVTLSQYELLDTLP